jgi:hypothetical protein
MIRIRNRKRLVYLKLQTGDVGVGVDARLLVFKMTSFPSLQECLDLFLL